MKSAVQINSKSRDLMILFILCVAAINACQSARTDDMKKDQTSISEDALSSSINMIPILTPESTFMIDRYEVTSLQRKMYITAPNQDPLTSVTLAEARAICNSLGKTLCTESQWLQACLGTSRLTYGYSSEYVQNRCNVSGDEIRPTGSYRECVSDGQIHDMLGNATEWVEADSPTTAGIIAGGSYMSGKETNCFARQIVSPNSRSPQVGFRCCKNG